MLFRSPDMPSFSKMLKNYGRGRAEQFRLHPTSGSALNFAPPALVIYSVAVAPFVLMFSMFLLLTADRIDLFLLLNSPLPIYFLLTFLSAVQTRRFPTGRNKADDSSFCISILRMQRLILYCHFGYGEGFLRGMKTTLKPIGDRPEVEVELEVAQSA